MFLALLLSSSAFACKCAPSLLLGSAPLDGEVPTNTVFVGLTWGVAYRRPTVWVDGVVEPGSALTEQTWSHDNYMDWAIGSAQGWPEGSTLQVESSPLYREWFVGTEPDLEPPVLDEVMVERTSWRGSCGRGRGHVLTGLGSDDVWDEDNLWLVAESPDQGTYVGRMDDTAVLWGKGACMTIGAESLRRSLPSSYVVRLMDGSGNLSEPLDVEAPGCGCGAVGPPAGGLGWLWVLLLGVGRRS